MSIARRRGCERDVCMPPHPARRARAAVRQAPAPDPVVTLLIVSCGDEDTAAVTALVGPYRATVAAAAAGSRFEVILSPAEANALVPALARLPAVRVVQVPVGAAR